MTEPFRASINFTLVAADQDDAAQVWDRVDEAIAAVTGIPTEGGAMEAMDPADVIDGSPLHEALDQPRVGASEKGERCGPAPFTIRLGDDLLTFDFARHMGAVRACTGCRTCLVSLTPAPTDTGDDDAQ